MKTALITGVLGQDGGYLAELLLHKGYRVVGVRRRSSSSSLWRLEKCLKNPNFELIEGDISDYSSVLNILAEYEPNEIYNLAAQSHVGTSFNQPGLTWDITAKGVLNILESIKFLALPMKLYQASSSEMFGTSFVYKSVDGSELYIKTQNENTSFNPQSPYAIAKLAAHNAVRLYREAYGIYAVGGILFNHESPRRGINFVTRKITSWFNDFCHEGTSTKLKLGNLDSSRDWGYAPEYVEAMWLMLQQNNPKDYVIGTGESHTIREFLQGVIDYHKKNNYLYNKYSIERLVDIDENQKRPAEVPYLRADISLAEKELGWKPKTKFNKLIEIMCEEENGLA